MNGRPPILSTSRTTTPPEPIELRPNLLCAWRGLWTLSWRARIATRKVPLLLLAILVIPGLIYFTIPLGGTKPFYSWALDIYLTLLVPLCCLFVCGAFVRDELQAGTLSFLLTRPVTRARFLCLSYLINMLWVQMLALATLLVILLSGKLRQVPEIISIAPIMLAAQVLSVFAYSAMSTFFGLISKRYIIIAVVYGLIVEVGIGRIPSNINALSMSHHIRTLLANSESIAEARTWLSEGTGWSIIVLCVAPLVFLTVSALLFTLREYHQGEEQQK